MKCARCVSFTITKQINCNLIKRRQSVSKIKICICMKLKFCAQRTSTENGLNEINECRTLSLCWKKRSNSRERVQIVHVIETIIQNVYKISVWHDPYIAS